MTNQEWIDLLSKEWNISRSSAKEMLHQMFKVKEIDNIKKDSQKPKVYIAKTCLNCKWMDTDRCRWYYKAKLPSELCKEWEYKEPEEINNV